jgi:hypothetical protein
VANVRDRLLGLASKIREARGRCERNGEIDRELGRLKSAISGVQGRCRDQKGIAASLVANTQSDRHQLVAKLAAAEQRAADLATELDYCRSLLQEVQMAVYAAEDAARKTAQGL